MQWERLLWGLPLAACALSLGVAAPASAHAVAGERDFPSTLNFDDPGIGAELPMVFSHQREDGKSVDGLDIGVTKPITPRFSLTAETGYGNDTDTPHGWDNLSIGGVWQLYVNPRSESIGSFSISHTFEHTGSHATRDPFSTWSPEFDFGKGFGSAGASWVRPFAVTGAVSADFPNHHESRMLNVGLSLQYSIPYLQDFVKDHGIKAPFNNMIPIVELPLSRCLNRGCENHKVSGYIAPGVIWVGHHIQWGVELMVPAINVPGHKVGVEFGVDLYLDDIFPHSFGKPIFD